MDNQTFRSRLVELIQKSRKAMRLYSSMGKSFGRTAETPSSEFADAQAAEWRSINVELVKHLSGFVETPNSKKLVADVLGLRENLSRDFRALESDLNTNQRELIAASENGDFVKAALLSRELVMLKARVQATQAAHHELDLVIRRSKVLGANTAQNRTIELSQERAIDSEENNEIPNISLISSINSRDLNTGNQLAKVIPLRKASR